MEVVQGLAFATSVSSMYDPEELVALIEGL